MGSWDPGLENVVIKSLSIERSKKKEWTIEIIFNALCFKVKDESFQNVINLGFCKHFFLHELDSVGNCMLNANEDVPCLAYDL